MPRRSDLRSILIIGSGPIVIGQACEFDYAGTQAVKALRDEGLRVVLVNSNPATIMTDPEIADATYVEPLTVSMLEQILVKERPQAILPTLGGQTGLNLAMAAVEAGVLERHGVELLGVSPRSIVMAEDRAAFKEAMARIGLACPRSRQVGSVAEARACSAELGFPVILRASFTLGGSGGGIARDARELDELTAVALALSPTHQVLIEESVIGWKEFELEVVRDAADNCIIVCSIENIDPMGVHTGDSITVAPAMTLTDKEYQRMRDAAFAIMREIGVTTGGSNVQFAVDPATGRLLVIEMNPRVSRSSALASKATGFPIAKVAAKLAIGYTLDELQNDITRVTPASFEPTIDYVVVKWPRFAFEKFPGAHPGLGPQMKSVGEAMSIGRTFREALGKVMRSLEVGRTGFDLPPGLVDELGPLERVLAQPNADRMYQLGRAFQLGLTISRAAQLTGIDPWFLHHIHAAAIAELELAGRAFGAPSSAGDLAFYAPAVAMTGLDTVRDELRSLKRAGLSDRRIAALVGATELEVRTARHASGTRPVYKRVDTCGAELASATPYLYSTYEDECEAAPTTRRKVLILGGGPNRIGQGIEFDYCCVHAAFAAREADFESIMVNCNPETVSTDYDTSDRLYFEPVTLEDVLEICDVERPWGVIVQLGGQTPLKLAVGLAEAGVPILGTPPDAIDRAEDRERFGELIAKLGLRAPAWAIARTIAEARTVSHDVGFPVMVRPSYVLGGRAMERIESADELEVYFRRLIAASGRPTTASEAREVAVVGLPLLIDRFLTDAIELDVDLLADREGEVLLGGVMEQVELAGVHSGDSACALPPYSLSPEIVAEVESQARAIARELGVIGLMNAQFAIHRGEVYVLEVNPRASRTIPFVSKCIGLPLAKLATCLMLGSTLRELGVMAAPARGFAVKEVVLPFRKFVGVEPLLGPEMRSTGEVMGLAPDFASAFAKSQLAAGNALPQTGTVLLSASGTECRALAPRFAELGFTLVTPGHRATELRDAGLTVADAAPAAIASGAIVLVVDLDGPGSPHAREAVAHGVSYLTTRRAVDAALVAIAAVRVTPLTVCSLQDLARSPSASVSASESL
ncbi:MAG: carbamoyl-phosphate synthase large subunit [Myxococcota bacterium]|nr:carbamoyl-phosphate synthase large subunit [Myxococcota bacterium]